MKSLIPFALLAVATAATAVDPLETVARPFLPEAVPLPVAPFDDAMPRDAASAASAPWRVLTQDITLERTLQRWARQAGYRLKWDAQRNFLIGAPDTYGGSFESALQSVLGSAGIRESDYPLEACIYANTPPLVRVTRQGEQGRECVAQ